MGTSDTTARLPDTHFGGEDETTRLAPGGELVLGRYRLERRIGAGGFGVVWLGYDERLERDVAIKVIPRGSDPTSERVQREALAAARLNHPGIVALYELTGDEHDYFLVSELVQGSTLAELSRAGAVADRDVARIGAALCDALEHAHERGVIHRDVKPQNVMVLAEPAAGSGFAKLADFGVAHLTSRDPVTLTGDVVGTLAYMAPEQAEGGRVTPASDVYSLALTVYEGLTGVNPVRAGSPAATARRVGRRLPPLRSRRRDLPPELCDEIDAALDRVPERRSGLADLRAALLDAEPGLSAEGGLVEPETRERFGLTTAHARTRFLGRDGELRSARALPVAAVRAGAGLAAGLLVLAAVETLGPEPPVSALGGAAVAALLVALLPRAGWIVSALAVCGWLASPEAGMPGTALVLAVALAPTPLLLPRAGELWSVPVIAPLLGTIALAPLYVALAGLASSAWRRAGLAAAGLLWLVVAEVVTGDQLLFGTADGTLSRSTWESSALDALNDALAPVATSPALAPIVVWVGLAALLPLVVRGRFLAVDVLLAALWAAALVMLHGVLGDLLATTTELDRARGVAAGALLGATVAVAAASLAPPLEDDRTPAAPLV
jgi:eukaryotic-like serine/threonine-protein kinase